MIASLRFISHFMWKEKLTFFLGLLLTVGVSTLAWTGPRVIAYIIDSGVVPGNQKNILKGALFLAAVELLRHLFNFLSQLTYATLGQNVIERVRTQMITHILKLPVSFFDKVTSGSMMTRVVNDANSLTDFFQSGFVSVLGNFASIAAIFVGLFTINAKLGLFLFVSFVPTAISCAWFSNKLKLVYEHARRELSELNSKLADLLFGMKTVRSLGLNEKKGAELQTQINRYTSAQMGIVGIHSLFHPMLTFGTGVLLFILVWKGLPLVETHELRIGQWIAALSYIVSVQQPLTDISDRWNFFLAGLTSIERIREIFHERREIMGKRSPSRFQEISFSNLSFAYHDSERSALLNVNLTLQRGDWIGVYGESGSGKSTLLQMIYGFYRAESGSLSWNGNSYLDLDYAELRSHFGMVEQFPFLFTGSIGENISLFGEHPFEPSALRDEFKGFALIQDLLGKLDHPVNERGNNLSMGQKQMIAFLRAYLARADIWILDEATAFFDSEAEKEVLAALERLNSETHSITVIQVAHRPEALESMDRLIRMDQGRLHHHH